MECGGAACFPRRMDASIARRKGKKPITFRCSCVLALEIYFSGFLADLSLSQPIYLQPGPSFYRPTTCLQQHQGRTWLNPEGDGYRPMSLCTSYFLSWTTWSLFCSRKSYVFGWLVHWFLIFPYEEVRAGRYNLDLNRMGRANVPFQEAQGIPAVMSLHMESFQQVSGTDSKHLKEQLRE